MNSLDSTANIIESLRELHGGDQSQIDVIFSDKNIIVEAPAGYGKTKTMVSRIAYLMATRQLLPPKKTLVLSFSVNAALKIKREVFTQLPQINSAFGSSDYPLGQVSISNYHGFCRSLLRAHGHQLNQKFNNLDTFKVVEEKNLTFQLENDKRRFLEEFDIRLRKADIQYIYENNSRYAQIVLSDLVPREIITYNGLLSIAIYLLTEKEAIGGFYHELFRAILVDEIQDTNTLALWLLTKLYREDQQISLFGDSVQQVYQFIGAVPEVMIKCKQRFNLEVMELKINHRFQANKNLLILDKNLRSNYSNMKNPDIEEAAKLDLYWFENQSDESSWISTKAIELSETSTTTSVAILVKQRGPNTEKIVSRLDELAIPFFYGLFTDESESYIEFHDTSVKIASNLEQSLQDYESIGKGFARKHQQQLNELYNNDSRREITACIMLLSEFWKDLLAEKRYFNKLERIEYVHQVFSNYGLKQFINKISSNISVCTIHAAKGLEWDYVILADVEQYLQPHSSVCNTCRNQRDCNYDVLYVQREKMLPEINLFYVGVTRARENVYVSGSGQQMQYHGMVKIVKPSCLLFMPGIQTNLILHKTI